jgi:hypothetical protein
MCRVKYFVNTEEPDAIPLAEQLRVAGIDFACVPTSGPLALWIDGRALYGPTAVRYAIQALVRSQKSRGQARQTVAL